MSRQTSQEQRHPKHRLTPEEFHVVVEVKAGKSVRQIAAASASSPKVVRQLLCSALRKLVEEEASR